MRHRVLAIFATACLCLMTYGSAWAASSISVWVALSDTGGAYAETASALRAELDQSQPQKIDWRIAHWSEFSQQKSTPQWVVAIGIEAQRGMQALFRARSTSHPMLVILVPRRAFERSVDQSQLLTGEVSAIYLDQPPGRQLSLIRLTLPDAHRVGLLVGNESKDGVTAFAREAGRRNLKIVDASVEDGGLFVALQSLLAEVDVLLALPDPGVYSSQTAGNILTATYRRQVPLIGFSPAYAKAGALVALYSTPIQIGRQGGKVLSRALTEGSLPPPQWPQMFSISVNHDVAHSLGLALDEQSLGEQLRQGYRP